MSMPFRKQVKIVKLPEKAAKTASPTVVDAEARERDSRPGRFTVKGTFINLSDRDEARPDESPR